MRTAQHRTILYVLFAAALALSLALFVLGSRRDHETTWGGAVSQTAAVAVLLEQHARGTLLAADQLAQRVMELAADTPMEETDSPPSLRKELRRLAGTLPFVAGVEIVSDRGVIASSSATPPGKEFAGRGEWFRQIEFGTSDHTVRALPREAGKRSIMAFLRRIEPKEDGAASAVLVAIRSEYLEHALRDAKTRPSATLSLFDEDGTLVFRNPRAPERLGQSFAQRPLFRERLTQAPVGTYVTTSSIDNLDRIVSYRALDGYPLVATASLGIEDVMSPWYARTAWTGMLWLAAAAAVAGFAALTRRALAQEASARQALEESNHTLSAAIDEKEVLFREVHHRVKNNLQIVASLLTLESGQIKDAAVRSRLQEMLDRVHSIAHVHRVLYKTNEASAVNLSRYLRELVDSLAATYGAGERSIALSVEGPPCTLDLERAIPVALIVNEVVTNAFKHAFPQGRSGTVTVRVSECRDIVTITVEDDGVGLPAGAAKGDSVGMRLIRSLVAQAEGAFSFRADGGTAFRLALPHSAAKPERVE